MKPFQSTMLASASLLAMFTSAYGQTPGATGGAPEERANSSSVSLEEIIVTARRKDERLQDVPITVNVVTSDNLEKLNIRKFDDIQTLVPGLSISSGITGTGAAASVRGVAFNAAASGLNGTVEFYLNDSPVSAESLFQTIFDIGQIEVLRGPQGTLRGRAAPSGSVTVTTRRPDLSEFGGYINTTGTDIGGQNANGALNLPIVSDKLAVRVAALYDENEGSRVESINNGLDPFTRSKAGRVSVRFEPTDSLSFDATYQHLIQNMRSYTQVESARLADPTLPASPIFIDGDDLRSVQDAPANQEVKYDNLNFRAQWAFAGQRLNYTGAENKRDAVAQARSDLADFFGPAAPAYLQGFGNFSEGHTTTRAHELRLASEERLFGRFDYIAGAFYQKLDSPTDLRNVTALVAPAPPGILQTIVLRRGGAKEQSYFGNLTMHLGEATEISGGLRYIDYSATGALIVNGVVNPAAAQDDSFNTTIYSASIKHNINDDMMVYATTGTSWRAGISVVGDFSLAQSPLERTFLLLPPEESESYEVGFKASALDKRLQTNVSIYHQKFDNYPSRSSSGVFYVETFQQGTALLTRPTSFNFVGAVPVEVNGVEVDVFFAATQNWDISATASYAKSEIQDGVVPCNDYFPRDGIPDNTSLVPTVAQIRTATGGDNLSACTVDDRASLSPPFSATVQSEYRVPFSPSLDGYVRGLVSYYGDSQTDPSNAVDDVSSYALVNLFLGIRDPNGAWEVGLYGKNITDTEEVLGRRSSPLTTPFSPGGPAVTTYREINPTGYTPPREFGLNLRYAFGSR